MQFWLLATLGAALAGGLLVLNGFADCKEASENVLDVYRDELTTSRSIAKPDRSPR